MGQLQVAKYIFNWSPQTKGEKGGTEKLFEEIMTKIVLNLMKTVNSQISDSWRIPSTRKEGKKRKERKERKKERKGIQMERKK